MIFAAMLVVAGLAASPGPTLLLEKIRIVDDPRSYDLRDQDNGDRGVPRSCKLSDGTSVTLVSAQDASIELDRKGTKKKIAIKDVAGLGRSTLACGDSDAVYYVNPRHGQVYAYSANRLFRGEDPIVWTHRVEPFRSMDEVDGVMTDASIATVLQTRQKLVLVEWFFRKDGVTGFWHCLFDSATGAELAKIGPSDLLMKTNEKDPWWLLFQGGGNETANYVPQAIYRLSYRRAVEGEQTAADLLEILRTQSPAPRLKAIVKLSQNPVINHMIALLTPTRTAQNARLEFCPTVPAQRARYWLGSEYDEMLGSVARNILLAFWAERQGEPANSSPIDVWFQAEIASKEPMKALLQHFSPQDDEWVAQYQLALLSLGRPEFERLFTTYGTATGAVVRTKD